MGHYRAYGDDALTGIANVVQKASPWDFLTGIFVTKPAQAEAAQVELARLQAQAVGQQAAARAQTLKYALLAGAGVVGVLVLVIALKPRRAAVAGYRKSKRSRR